jgi:hypothetical protein
MTRSPCIPLAALCCLLALATSAYTAGTVVHLNGRNS